MTEGVTTSGFKYALEDAVFDDWELLEELEALESGDPSATIRLMRRLLGEEQFKALKEHLRDPETGRVKASDMLKAQHEIMGTDRDPAKNS